DEPGAAPGYDEEGRHICRLGEIHRHLRRCLLLFRRREARRDRSIVTELPDLWTARTGCGTCEESDENSTKLDHALDRFGFGVVVSARKWHCENLTISSVLVLAKVLVLAGHCAAGDTRQLPFRS